MQGGFFYLTVFLLVIFENYGNNTKIGMSKDWLYPENAWGTGRNGAGV
jgi:hypothetical protein